MTDTAVPLTDDEIRTRALELRPHWGNPLHWAYEALSTLHHAIEAARAADDTAHELLLQCSSAMTDEVIEISGASELWDVVAAIQHLAESYTGSTVDESSRIPAAVAAERLDQLTDRFDRTAGCFDPPFPFEERLAALREEHDPMPKAGEITIGRLLAAAADPDSIEPWVFRGVEPATIHERLDRVESDLQMVSDLLDELRRE